MNKLKTRLVNTLKHIKAGHRPHEECGICTNYWAITSKHLEADLRTLNILWSDWPHFSGSVMYPVEGCLNYACNDNKYIGKWGQRRMELIDWLLEQLQVKN